MVPPCSDQVSRVWPYSGSCAAAPIFTYVTLTLFGGPSHALRLTVAVLKAVHTPEVFLPLVWPLPHSLATTYGISVDVSSSPYLDVSVQAVPSIYLWIQYMVPEYCSGGFPHSDIRGSTLICSSPQLFAAYHVFLRLPVPRHSPCALFSLTVFLAFLILLFRQQDQNKIVVFYFFLSYLISQLLFSFQGACSISASSRCLRTRFTVDRWLILAFASYKRSHSFSAVSSFSGSGGLKWTRTTDLALIRRAL